MPILKNLKPKKVERKAINFELKDIDKGKREAVIAHATYNDMDRIKDIARKGMFTKSWNESKSNGNFDINFYLNHNDEQAPGKVTDVFEDDNHAYTKTWMGTHTLGNDVLLMMDEGVIKKASFGYITVRSNKIEVKNTKARELKEVVHLETSVLTKIPCHPKSGVVSVTKALYDLAEVKTLSSTEQQILKNILSGDQGVLEELIRLSANIDTKSDLYTWISWNISRRADMMGDVRSQLKWNSGELKEWQAHVTTMEKFCRDTNASDDCIKSILIEIDETKQLISEYNTAGTHADDESPEPAASIDVKELLSGIQTFNNNLIKK